MFSWNVRIVFLLTLYLLKGGCAYADEQLSHISTEDFLQYRVWSAARDYRFGMTVEADPVQALSWQYIYVNRLPQSYRLKHKLLEPFLAILNTDEQHEAQIYSEIYRDKFQLQYTFNEQDLSVAYNLRDNLNFSGKEISGSNCSIRKTNTVQEWIDEIKTSCNKETGEKLEQIFFDLQSTDMLPIVYGQVRISGPEAAFLVNSNIPILNQGFFLAQAPEKRLYFEMPGYQLVVKKLNKEPLQFIDEIELQPTKNRDKTGLMGRIYPYTNSDDMNVVIYKLLFWKSEYEHPLYTPLVHLTVTQDGLFYARGLSKGKYRLLIKTKKLALERVFTIREGEVRSLSIINVEK